MGYQNSTAGTALSEAYLDEEAKQSVMVYATAAARTADAALGSVLREGMVSYVSDLNSLQLYDGSAWRGVRSTVHGPGAAASVTANSTTPVVANTLVVPDQGCEGNIAIVSHLRIDPTTVNDQFLVGIYINAVLTSYCVLAAAIAGAPIFAPPSHLASQAAGASTTITIRFHRVSGTGSAASYGDNAINRVAATFVPS